MTPGPTQRLCERHSPGQSAQSRGGKVLFKRNKAQITQPSPNEQAGSCICSEQDSYLTQEAWRFWASFSPTWSFSWFRSSRASSPGGGTSQTHSHKPLMVRLPGCWVQTGRGLMDFTCLWRSQGGLPCDRPPPACEPTHSHLGTVSPSYLQSSALQAVILLGIQKTSQATSLSQHLFFIYIYTLLLACMGFSAGTEQPSTLPVPFIRTRTFSLFI